ncbi:MAG: hypothetical protein ACRD2J_03540 [Thermoanaerobaculia bacterium]
MSRVAFDALPDEARTWVFAAAAPLDARSAEIVRGTIDAFLEGWSSHGEDVPAAARLVEGRFLVVAADEAAVTGGCSVDRLFRTVRDLRRSAGIDFLETTRVYWRDGEAVASATRDEFRRLAESGSVTSETIVYDTTAERLAEVRSGAWSRPAAESWHARAFPLRRAS